MSYLLVLKKQKESSTLTMFHPSKKLKSQNVIYDIGTIDFSPFHHFNYC